MPLALHATSSRVLKAIVYLHWAAPIGYLLALVSLYNLSMTLAVSTFFSFYYFARSAFTVYVGFSLYQAKPWAWHFFLINALLLTGEQFYFGLILADTHIVFAPITVALSFLALAIFLVKIEFCVPYFSPKIHWWESDPRYKISLPTKINFESQSFSGEILDISASGCFIKTKTSFNIQDSIEISFTLFDREFKCKGIVVWRTESTLTRPKGVGLKFFQINKQDHYQLKHMSKKLRGISKKMRRTRREEKVSILQEKLKDKNR